MIITQEIVLILQGKRFRCKALQVREFCQSAKVYRPWDANRPSTSQIELLYTMIFCIYIIEDAKVHMLALCHFTTF